MNDPNEASPMDLEDLKSDEMDEVAMDLDMATPGGDDMPMDFSESLDTDLPSTEIENGDLPPSSDRRRKAVLGVPIEVVISVGKARPLLSELVGLRRDSVLMLDSKIEDPVEILVGDRVIARGELQEVDSESGRLCVRLTEVADLSQSL